MRTGFYSPSSFPTTATVPVLTLVPHTLCRPFLPLSQSSPASILPRRSCAIYRSLKLPEYHLFPHFYAFLLCSFRVESLLIVMVSVPFFVQMLGSLSEPSGPVAGNSLVPPARVLFILIFLMEYPFFQLAGTRIPDLDATPGPYLPASYLPLAILRKDGINVGFWCIPF